MYLITNSTKYQMWPKFFTVWKSFRDHRKICHISYSHIHAFLGPRTDPGTWKCDF